MATLRHIEIAQFGQNRRVSTTLAGINECKHNLKFRIFDSKIIFKLHMPCADFMLVIYFLLICSLPLNLMFLMPEGGMECTCKTVSGMLGWEALDEVNFSCIY